MSAFVGKKMLAAAAALALGLVAVPALAATRSTGPVDVAERLVAAPLSGLAPIDADLTAQLAVADGTPLVVAVHGTDLAAARDAVAAAGLPALARYDRIGVVVTTATPTQIAGLRAASDVIYVEGDEVLRFDLDTSNEATRGAEVVDGIDISRTETITVVRPRSPEEEETTRRRTRTTRRTTPTPSSGPPSRIMPTTAPGSRWASSTPVSTAPIRSSSAKTARRRSSGTSGWSPRAQSVWRPATPTTNTTSSSSSTCRATTARSPRAAATAPMCRASPPASRSRPTAWDPPSMAPHLAPTSRSSASITACSSAPMPASTGCSSTTTTRAATARARPSRSSTTAMARSRPAPSTTPTAPRPRSRTPSSTTAS